MHITQHAYKMQKQILQHGSTSQTKQQPIQDDASLAGASTGIPYCLYILLASTVVAH